MKTVLFIPFGIGLAHIGRLIMIARELKKTGAEVVFGAGKEVAPLITKEKMRYIEIPEFTKEIYNKKIKNNNFFIYSRNVLEEFVNAELALYDKVQPDLVVYDMRITVKISTEIAGIPTVAVTNVNLTPYYDYSKVVFPVNTYLYKYLPAKVIEMLNKEYGQEFVKRIAPKILQAFLIGEIIKLSPTLLRLGYRLKRDPYQLFLGDETLLTDIPEYRPVIKLPDKVKVIGPIFWDGGQELPDFAAKIKDEKNIVYVSAGGTGDKKLFLKILEYLKDTDFTIVATTGNTFRPESVKIKHKNLFITDYLPGSFILSKVKLAIFPGGNASCYQVLNYGVPQVLTPLHIDQEDNANQLERLRTGKMINPYSDFNKKNFLLTVNEVLSNKIYKSNAQNLQKIMKGYDGPNTAAESINKLLN